MWMNLTYQRPDGAPVHQTPHAQRRAVSDRVGVFQRNDFRGVTEHHPEVLRARLAHLEDGLDVLRIPLPRGLAELAARAPGLEYVGEPVLLEVGVELLGRQCQFPWSSRDADHVGTGVTKLDAEQAGPVRS